MTDDAFAQHLAGLLADPDPQAAVQLLAGDLAWLTALAPARDLAQPVLPPLGALGIFAGALALARTGAGARAWPFMEEAVAAYAAAHPAGRRAYRWHTAGGDALALYPELRVAAVEALVAGERWSDTAHALGELADLVRRETTLAFSAPENAVALAGPLDAARAGGWLGPVWPDAAWLHPRHAAVIASGALDERCAHAWKLYADHLLDCLRLSDVAGALALVEAKAEAAQGICDEGHETGNYHFNVLCVLARAGRIAEAVAATRELVRRGYWGLWRLRRDAAAESWWVAASGQGAWLAAVEGELAYQKLRARYVEPADDFSGKPVPGPFRSLHRGVLGGKARKRCVVSRRLIAPGEPVYRFRLYHGRQPDEPFVAAVSAFDASALATWRYKHEADGYVMGDFARARRRASAHKFEHPDVARFVFDLAEGGPFDLDALIDLLAEPRTHPMRFTWRKDEDHRAPEPPDGPFVNDALGGDFVNLAALVLRCGHGPALFARLAGRPAAQADPVAAMLATFGRADCRAGAAHHFGLPDLPAIMDVAFGPRPTLEDTLRLAGYGGDHPRFAEALAGALARYNLHLYSNYAPQADWWLQDLEHHAYAKGCQLLYLFALCPERVPVLATMIERRWLVEGVSLGGYDGYENAAAFFWRTAVTNRMLVAPDELPLWLGEPWMERLVRGPTLREAKRHVAAYAKRTGRRGGPG